MGPFKVYGALNIIHPGYNDTRLQRHKTFIPFRDVIRAFDLKVSKYSDTSANEDNSFRNHIR